MSAEDAAVAELEESGRAWTSGLDWDEIRPRLLERLDMAEPGLPEHEGTAG